MATPVLTSLCPPDGVTGDGRDETVAAHRLVGAVRVQVGIRVGREERFAADRPKRVRPGPHRRRRRELSPTRRWR
jgi:hypothetical protein